MLEGWCVWSCYGEGYVDCGVVVGYLEFVGFECLLVFICLDRLVGFL